MNEEWFWEGNVVQSVCNYLVVQGWKIEKVADTATRENGHDIRARRNNDVLIVEVKGFPSKMYATGEKKGQLKPTAPYTQARHWYSQAILSALLIQDDYPKAICAIAFPEYSTYRKLIGRTRHALSKLGIVVYVVTESGTVNTYDTRTIQPNDTIS